MPRRKILIEIEAQPENLPQGNDRLAFNRFLQSWYNRYPDGQEEEPLQLVSYSRWKEELPEAYQQKRREGAEIAPEDRANIENEIRRIVKKTDLEIKPEMDLAFDLGMDSLQIAELLSFIDGHFEVQHLHPGALQTIQDVLEAAAGAQIEPPIQKSDRLQWPKEIDRPPPMFVPGETIQEVFLHSCERMGRFAASGDDLIGTLRYTQIKRAALILSQEFKRYPDERIGVLLPASTGAFLVIFAILLAGKVPVMLNWTVGAKSLEEMVKTAEIYHVVSSWNFIDRVSHVDFGTASDMMQLIEDIRQRLTLSSRLRGFYLSFFKAKNILKKLRLDVAHPDHWAVILFTSGTEAAPKGVPLSHKNILSNLRSGMQCLDLKGSDALYGILPPFHSFGFSVAGVFAFLGGLKIAFYPDPTDRFALAEGIERWKITLFCATPSFLKGLLAAAKEGQLRSVRFFITGAEKTAQELYDRVNALGTGAKILEGYGITECSPVITLNCPDAPPKGVGRPLPGIELVTIHPETSELLQKGQEGEICVCGPNVFGGYLGNPRSPFIEIQGKRWYRTGDIGRIEEGGYLILTGRLKRFIKIGGEMISLESVEEALAAELSKQEKSKPSLAVLADEKNGEPQLILFTTIQIDTDGANKILSASGLSRLVKISSVQSIPEMPLLGTGKIDYRHLQQQLSESK